MGKIKTTKSLTPKDVIIQKAAELFKEKGYKATGMRELAELLGIEASSLYNHIKSKSELLHLICFDIANKYTKFIEKVEQEQTTNYVKVEKLIQFHIKGMLYNIAEVYVSDREWKHLEEPYLSNFQTQRRNYRKRLTAIIEQGIAQQEFKQMDAPTAVLILLHAIGGVESWHRSKHKIDGKLLEQNMISILMDGLKK